MIDSQLYRVYMEGSVDKKVMRQKVKFRTSAKTESILFKVNLKG